MQTTVVNKSDEYKIALLELFTRLDNQKVDDSLNHTGQVKVGPIEIGPGTWGDEKRREVNAFLTKSTNRNEVWSSRNSMWVSKGDPTIAGAWTTCIKEGGLTTDFNTSGPNQAIFQITWYPFPQGGDAAMIDFSARMCTPGVAKSCSDAKLLSGQPFARGQRPIRDRTPVGITIERDPKKDLTVSGNTSRGEIHGYLPASLATAPFSIRLRVTGSIDYRDGTRDPIDFYPLDYNFEIPLRGAWRTFMLTITQITNDKECAKGTIAPGALNFPAGTQMDSTPEFRDVFQGGGQVTTTNNLIQVFIDPKRCAGTEPNIPPPLTR